MNNAQEYLDYVKSIGYANESALYFCGVINMIEAVKNDIRILIYCTPDDEFDAYLKTLKDGDLIEHDLNKYIVTSICVGGIVCTERNFIDGENEGIILEKYPNEYNTHQLNDETLKQAIYIQEHPSEYLGKFLKAVIKHIDDLSKNLFPILRKYEFYEVFNSLLDLYNSDNCKDSSDLCIDFGHRNLTTLEHFTIFVDCFDLKLKISNFEDIDFSTITQDELEPIFVKRVLYDKEYGTPKLEFSYMLNDDPKDNRESYREVLKLSQVRNLKELESINLDNIPESRMYRYEALKNKFTNENN